MADYLIPNSTQIPHLIIRVWLPRLKDVELRILLIVADQTLGWVEDDGTGRRKEKDWISHGQLIKRTGRESRAISKGLKTLIEDYRLIEAYDEEGNALDSADKRQRNGSRIYYRLALKKPPATLFDTPAKSAKVGENRGIITLPSQKVRTQKVRTTKLTSLTKSNTLLPATPEAPESKEKAEKAPSRQGTIGHSAFVRFFYDTTQKTRGIKPIITGQDGANLKRILNSGIDEMRLEQLATYFLADYSFKKFSPTISTFLSAGILTGLLNRANTEAEFWKKLDGYTLRYIPHEAPTPDRAKTLKTIAELKAKILGKSIIDPQQRSEILEETRSFAG